MRLTLKDTPKLAGMVTLGLMAALSIGCRSESDRKAEQSRNEPSTNMTPPPPPAAEPAPGAAAPENQPPAIGGGPTTPQGKTTPSAALASLAAADCDREVRCNNVGPNKHYPSREVCIAMVQNDKGKKVSAQACPGGINEGNLNECLKSLRKDSCGNFGDTLSRAEACKLDGICVK
jgi:hypothetical protein